MIYIFTILFLCVSQVTCFVGEAFAYDKIIMPRLSYSTVIVDYDDKPPIEPVIVEVKFKRLPVLTSLDERVDRLVNGIVKDIPPEYDHYGYELRRYMAHIGNLEIYRDKEYLIEQIKNVKSAEIILNYWQKFLKKEIKEMTPLIDGNMKIPPIVRSEFKQNAVTAETFLLTLKLWIEANDQLLKFIYNNYDSIEMEYPEFFVSNSKKSLDLYNLISARQSRLKEVVSYRPYAMMVY